MDKPRPASVSTSVYTEDGEEEPEDFPSAEVEASHFKSKYIEIYRTLQETKAELDDFQSSSKELEEELERELLATEEAQQDLRTKITKLEGEKDDWKSKYLAAQKAHNLAQGTLQRELDTTKAERDRLKVSLRDLEMGVDDLERNERMVSSSLQDVESRYNRAIEEKTMLEQELIGKQQLEEEAQRLKDEIRDLNTEVSVLKEQRSRPLPAPPSAVPGHLMSPVRESSQELSLSDLVMPGDASFADSSFASISSPNPGESPTPYFTRPEPFPSRVSHLPQSPSVSRLPMPSSPSQLPRSSTARILNGYTNDRSSTVSSPTSGPSRPGSRTLPSNGSRSVSAPSTATKAPDSRSRGIRMVSDIGERARTLGNRLQNTTATRTRKVPGTAGAVPPPLPTAASQAANGGPSHPRMKALAGTNGPVQPGTPGTPGTADWVLVSEGEDSPSPPTPPTKDFGGRGSTSSAGGALRKSTTQTFSGLNASRSTTASNASSSTATTLPSRKAIPSPLGAVYQSQSVVRPPSRPSSRTGHSLSNSTRTAIPSRPTTPSNIPRPSSPALSSSGIAFPSSSSNSASTSARPRVLGASSFSRPSATNPSSYSSTGEGALRRSIRRISLDQSSLPPVQHSSSRPAAPRTSLSSSMNGGSRPVSAPVPPRNPPPVPAIPANYARRQGGVGQPSSKDRPTPSANVARAGMGALKVLGRARSSTGGGSDGPPERF